MKAACCAGGAVCVSKVPNVAAAAVHAAAAAYALSQVGSSDYASGGWIDVQRIAFNTSAAGHHTAIPMTLVHWRRVNVLLLLGVIAAASAVTHAWFAWSGASRRPFKYGNRGRWWFEYPVTAPLMAVVVALFCGLRLLEVLVLAWGCMAACVLAGGGLQWPRSGQTTVDNPPPPPTKGRYSAPSEQEDASLVGRVVKPVWNAGDTFVAWAASMAPFAAFVVVCAVAWHALSTDADPPAFVNWLVLGVLVAFCVFPVLELAASCGEARSVETTYFAVGNAAKIYLYAVYLFGSRL